MRNTLSVGAIIKKHKETRHVDRLRTSLSKPFNLIVKFSCLDIYRHYRLTSKFVCNCLRYFVHKHTHTHRQKDTDTYSYLST